MHFGDFSMHHYRMTSSMVKVIILHWSLQHLQLANFYSCNQKPNITIRSSLDVVCNYACVTDRLMYTTASDN